MFQRRCFQNYECLTMHALDVRDFVRFIRIFLRISRMVGSFYEPSFILEETPDNSVNRIGRYKFRPLMK